MIDQIYILPILLFSVVIHEISHGYMALRLGDSTARDMGRLTLNPIPHIDPVGSILVPLFSLFVTGQVFIAWAKPVPVNPMNFSNYRRDDILVSVIGPVSNIFLALVCTICFIIVSALGLLLHNPSAIVVQAFEFLLRMFGGGITLNIILAVFNMIPIPPLDGSHVVASLLPDDTADRFRSLGFYGIFIILILMRWPPFNNLFGGIVGLLITPFQSLITLFLG
jgi:Zn-dependent protease